MADDVVLVVLLENEGLAPLTDPQAKRRKSGVPHAVRGGVRELGNRKVGQVAF